MLSPEETELEALAAAVLDGTEINWGTEESPGPAGRLPFIEQLKIVEAVAAVHRHPRPVLEQWAHLRVVELIGRGSFGEVFRAWDTRLDREVALKLLPAPGEDDASSFISEGRLLARVRHPNVATIYGADQIDNRIGLWMEFIRGRTLEQVLQNGSLSAAETVRIGIEICHAVAAVHRAGLLHRDIKAQNVMLADDGRVVLMDFGSGRELKDGSASDRSGTPLYQAPEVMAGQPATIQSDVYSVGILLFHLLSRSYPVHAASRADLRQIHETGQRVALETCAPGVPAPLARVVRRAIAPLPERRYDDTDAMARDLTALQHRSWIKLFRYGLVAAAALVLAIAAFEGRARLIGDDRGWRERLVSMIGESPNPVQAPVIVVLPFTNLSSDPAGSRLIDSLTIGLIQQLGKVIGLKVVSQETSFALRNKRLDLASVTQQAGVTLVLKGDAQLSGGKLVILASLQAVDGGEPLWAGTLTRPVRSPGDLTDVVADIARTIVNKLRLKLGPTQHKYTTDMVTYERYLKARELRDEGFFKAREAIPLFEEVIGRDPSFAPALAALAGTYGSLAMFYPAAGGFAMAPDEAVTRMEPLIAHALELDPAMAEAHASQALLHALALRWVDAEASFRHAIELNPTSSAVYSDFVVSTLEPWGRLDESLTTLQAALIVDPLSLDLRRSLSRIQLNLGRFDDAMASCRQVLTLDPTYTYASELCARALAAQGRSSEALALFNRRPEMNEGWIGHVYATTGRREEAEAIAARNRELPNRQALIYAGLGDKDRTFEALNRLAVLNPRRAGALLNSTELAAVRGDPRILEMRRKMGFPAR